MFPFHFRLIAWPHMSLSLEHLLFYVISSTADSLFFRVVLVSYSYQCVWILMKARVRKVLLVGVYILSFSTKLGKFEVRVS